MPMTKRLEFVTAEKLSELVGTRKRASGLRGRPTGEVNKIVRAMSVGQVVLVRHDCTYKGPPTKCNIQATVGALTRLLGYKYRTMHIPDGRLAILRKE